MTARKRKNQEVSLTKPWDEEPKTKADLEAPSAATAVAGAKDLKDLAEQARERPRRRRGPRAKPTPEEAEALARRMEARKNFCRRTGRIPFSAYAKVKKKMFDEDWPWQNYVKDPDLDELALAWQEFFTAIGWEPGGVWGASLALSLAYIEIFDRISTRMAEEKAAEEKPAPGGSA